jgi:hypothetical protein
LDRSPERHLAEKLTSASCSRRPSRLFCCWAGRTFP